MKRLLVTAISCLLLNACVSTGMKPVVPGEVNVSQPSKADQHYQKGYKAQTAFEQTDRPGYLLQAQKHYQAALNLAPYMLDAQLNNYRVIYTLSGYIPKTWYPVLENTWATLHPEVKKRVRPPAFMKALLWIYDNESPKSPVRMLTASTHREPSSADNWFTLAEAFEDQKEYDMALHAGLQALERAPESPQIAALMARVLNSKAITQDCPAAFNQARKDTIRYTLTAAQNADEEHAPALWNQLIDQYQIAGVNDLALQTSRFLHQQDPSTANARLLAKSWYATGDADQTQTLLTKLSKDTKLSGEEHLALANIHVANGRSEEARKAYHAATQSAPNSFEIYLINSFMQQIHGEADNQPLILPKNAKTTIQKDIIKALDVNQPPTELLNADADICTRSSAHFYSALYFWQQGDTKRSDQHFEKTLAQNNFGSLEYQMAALLLNNKPSTQPIAQATE
ncbi:Uncharacterised protein [BD1-7 clade bacterium]|uniref:Beta-barrel assembly-enhancing protease n=1 Tax=BD1-7 clade bacterium TaxID=2029982 RepID=A0A5S9Q2W3_9GAMM|nr:Uncharacterised protein [BD1-7 clade bacterium]CAA0111898.1 Uncharacterised protein [BD1-7 clade bacterium]